MATCKKIILTAGVIAVALVLASLIRADRPSGEKIPSTQESKKVRRSEKPSNESSQQESRTEQIRRIRIAADDIARLPARKNFLVDLTRPRVVYEFDSKSPPIDFTRITVHSASGDSTIEAWLKTYLPSKAGGSWKSGRLRIGAAKDLGFFGIRHPGGFQHYNNDGEGHCDCDGEDDCIGMFNGSACIDNGVCIDDDPKRPRCYCRCNP